MPTQAKPGTPRSAEINSEVKSWIDNVIVPVLVKEYLDSEEKRGKPLRAEKPMVQCPDSKNTSEEDK
jgi:hypothetical protein